MSFKVGDRVVITTDKFEGKGRTKGCLATVEYIPSDGTIRAKEDGGSQSWTYLPGELELVSNSKKGITMDKIKDLFKSTKQRLLEKYVYNGDGIKWDSYVVQKVFIEAFEKELIEACREEEEKEEDAKS